MKLPPMLWAQQHLIYLHHLSPKNYATSIKRINSPIVVVQDQEQVDKLLEVKDKLPQIKKVVYIDPTGMTSYENDPWLISYARLLEDR